MKIGDVATPEPLANPQMEPTRRRISTACG